MGTRDKPQGASRPTGGARAYRSPAEKDKAKDGTGERGMSSVAMRARKGKKQEREKAAPERGSREEARPAGREDKVEKGDKAEKDTEGEQTIRKGIYLSALIFVEGEWPAARDFAGPAKSAVKGALSQAFEGAHDGLTIRLKELEVRNDVEEDGGEDAGEPKGEEKFQF